MFVGLVSDPRWEPPDGAPEPERPRVPRGVWGTLAWVVLFWVLLLVAPVLGGVLGWLAIVVAVAVASWRVERWCSRQYWGGLREYQG